MSNDTPRPWLDSYAEGVPHEITASDDSLVDLIAGSAKEFRTRTALEFFGAETSYGELGDRIDRAAEGLRKLGVRKGDPVAIVLPNCPQHVIAFYAILRLGAIVVEHNPLYTPRELRHQFEDHEAKVVIAWDKTVATLQEFPADVAAETIVSVDITRAMPAGMRALLRLPIPKARRSRADLTTKVRGTVTWEQLVDHKRIKKSAPAPTADDVAVIQYTSGTTGTPKGAVLTHLNLNANAAQSRAWVPQIERGNCVVYAVLPLFHAYGLTLCLTFAMSMGARLVLFPKFDPDLVLPVIKKHPPTFLPAVPPIYERLTAAAAKKKVGLGGIQIAISGAMPLSEKVVAPWEEATGGYLVEGYGLSEASPVISANPVADNRKAGTIGLPLPSTEVRVVDREDPTKEVAPGEDGELLVRGPQIFQGYYRKPEQTAEVFLDGWFRTGDIVRIDDEGFIKVVDRAKELIITGGFNVSPSEVEDALRGFPGVADVAVVGIPDDRDGEHVVAVVVPKPGETVDGDTLRAKAREQLTPYKVPRQVFLWEELPKSLIGKVLRKKVRDALVEGRAGGSA
ncbi:long-chain-fatty-acid--CoA ligase [Schumannella sp. 10F1B-5-1]|uniref:long-chain-fatty-acid--CoA ligase n=1 Tax=Schumannella sp. 10F1B-5-1 TaxID=2590780 RepID=UPI00113233B9|nr:long-chain-fatty-acid--CoA ligase [Schumannella sp. 10F1B-5-1]TPW76870.1 AMP-binding protein [Schumannella sp. 10F1B-5-1]